MKNRTKIAIAVGVLALGSGVYLGLKAMTEQRAGYRCCMRSDPNDCWVVSSPTKCRYPDIIAPG